MQSDVLAGLRILAVEQYGAGPFGTQVLADLGAEVIKIEDPASGGDVARTVGPYFSEALPPTADSFFFQGLNRSKKSIALNLAHPQGRAVFERLVAQADAVANNLRGDVPARLGLNYEALAAINPKIVCGHLTGYGRGGERADWPGYDYLMQAETGYFHLTGDPDGPPSRMGLSLVDLMTGVALGLGIVSAVMSARASGRGRDVRREPLRHGALQSELYRPLVSQRRHRHLAACALGASVADPLSDLQDERRLDLSDVQQGKVLARVVRSHRPPRMDQ